ncbi:gram-negative bacteria-binding protein 3-like [Hermetia illucens]|nr:gram-negative bacteria-binding protein 3-like [Hermetia illucens]
MFCELLTPGLLVIVAGLAHVGVAIPQYDVPPAKIEVFYPRGFQVSIPAEEGVTLFAFHGKLNEEMDGLEAGTWARDIVKAKGGRFTFRDRTTALKIGDVLYYWTYVIYNGLGYREDDGKYVVTGYVNKTGNDNPWLTPTQTTPKETTTDCRPSVTIVNGVLQQCAERLVFDEQFSGNAIDDAKWTEQRRFAGQPDFEFVTYLPNTEVVFVKNNNLFVKPMRLTDIYGDEILRGRLNFGTHCTGEIGTENCLRRHSFDILPPIISGQISTKGHFSFLYGSIQIRAKVPDIKWAFPQLFLDPSEFAYGKSDYSSGQMRVGFTDGISKCTLSGGVILAANRTFRNLKMCEKLCNNGEGWNADYHVYGMKWTPDVITLSVDGQEYCEIDPGTGFGNIRTNGFRLPTADLLNMQKKIAPFDKPFHITIGVGVGGHNDYSDRISNKPWSNLEPKAMLKFWNSIKQTNYPEGELAVDYIQVFTV